MVTVDIAVFSKGKETTTPQVLLIQRKNDPYKDCWALPGGFVDMDETLKDAARRELNEETGVDLPNATDGIIEVGAFGNPGRDPRGRTISIAYTIMLSIPVAPTAGDDAKTAQMFSITEIPELAFDHDKIIKSAIQTLKLAKKW